MDRTKLLLFGEESERLKFRKLLEADFGEWLIFCADESSIRYFGLSEKRNAEEKCRAWFDRIFNRYTKHLGGLNALVHKETGAFIGQSGLLVQQVDGAEELEIGYSLMPALRGKGYALEAAKKCRDYAFENGLTDTLISIIQVDNHSSSKVAEHNGMTFSKSTTYESHPVNIYRITKAEWEKLK